MPTISPSAASFLLCAFGLALVLTVFVIVTTERSRI
jgi:hypothetical protein